MEEKKYYNFEDIMEWLNFEYFLRDKFPFKRGDYENIKAGWGMLIIPREGIEETVEIALNNINKPFEKEQKYPLKEISMIYQIPFTYNDSLGIINKNISLTFRYDKEYKYGDINKNIAECCYAIIKYGKRMNDFYIIEGEYLFNFMSDYIINNQWGLGCENLTTFVTKDLSCLKPIPSTKENSTKVEE